EDIEEISMLEDKGGEHSNHWLSPILLNSETITPQIVIDRLNQENIESRPIWKPMHLQPVFEEYEYFGNDVSKTLFETGVCLPSDTKMTKEEQDRVIKAIRTLW